MRNTDNNSTDQSSSSIIFICMLTGLALTTSGYSNERTETYVRNEITSWMQNHPVMGTKTRTITKVLSYPNATTPGAVSVISLAPSGTVVVNRDTRLPMVAIFTETTIEDLRIFDAQVAHAAQILTTLGTGETYTGVNAYTPYDVYVPAMLQTQWGQRAPYNNAMPINPKMGGPAVTGCGAIAFAQIVNHYQWPPYGEGSRNYTDTAGKFNPSFSADFKHNYRWDLMQNRYDINDKQIGAKNVAQLVYEMTLMGDIDCETNVSGMNLDLAGERLASYLFYEKQSMVGGDAESRQAIEINLRNGIPVPADISINTNRDGHAVVFDGLLVHNGTTSYHTNYGWDGACNVWWDKDALFDIWQAKPGIRPALIALPGKPDLVAKQGETLRLPWKIAPQRKDEAKELNLYQEVSKNGTWMDDCESLPAAVEARTWTLDNNSISGKCWKANSPYPAEYLTIADSFVPTNSSTIEFQEKHLCADNYMQVEVSVADAEFEPIFTFAKGVRMTWQQQSVSLASFTGKQVRIRLAYHAPPGSVYCSNEVGGGIWIDNMRVTGALVKNWELIDTIPGKEIRTSNGLDFITEHPKLANLPIGSYNFSASLADNYFERRAIKFAVTITQTGEIEKFEKFEVRDRNKLEKSGSTLNIGSTKINAKKTYKVIIENTGNLTMQGIQVKTTGGNHNDFTTALNKSTLAPGAKATLLIKFTPSKKGLRRITATIQTNAGTGFRFKLIGRGK